MKRRFNFVLQYTVGLLINQSNRNLIQDSIFIMTTGSFSILTSSLESSSGLKMSNQVVRVHDIKNLEPPLPAFGLRSYSTLSPLFVKKLFCDHSLYDEAEGVQLSAAEVQGLLADILANKDDSRNDVKEVAKAADEKISILRSRVDKIIGQLTQIEKNAQQKVADKVERMHARVTHSLDREVLAKQKLEQIKTKYKLKKHEMKKELKRYKKHYEASKKVWTEKLRIVQKEADVLFIYCGKLIQEQRAAKEKYLGLYLDKLAEIDTELSAILDSAIEKVDEEKGSKENPLSFRPLSENTIKAKLKKLKENVEEYKSQKPWMEEPSEFQKSNSSITPPASQSASLNKAFVQSGTLGIDPKEGTKTGNNSKLSITQQQRSIAPLNESQMRQYFGSNHTLLSVTQREKILYSIINRSVNYEAGGNDVRIEDVLNISKAGSVKATPTGANPPSKLLVMEDSTEAKEFAKELSPMFSSGEPPAKNEKNSVKNDQQLSFEPSLIDTPGKFNEQLVEENLEENKRKDDTLEISFKENTINEPHMGDLNEGDTLKDLNEAIASDKPLVSASEEKKQEPAIDSLELSAIGPPAFESPASPEAKDNFDSSISMNHSTNKIETRKKRSNSFFSKTANSIVIKEPLGKNQNKSFGAVPEGQFLPDIAKKPREEKTEFKEEQKKVPPSIQPQKVLARIGGKKVTLLVRRSGSVNQTVDCIDRTINNDTSTDAQNVTTIDSKPMKLKLVKRPLGKLVLPQSSNTQAQRAANNKSLSEIPVSPNMGQNAGPMVIKVKTPQKLRARFNAFTVKARAPTVFSINRKAEGRQKSNDVQQTPEFSSKGECFKEAAKEPATDEAANKSMQHLRAINSAINKIIETQSIKSGSGLPTVVNINIQSQTSYNTAPARNAKKTEIIKKELNMKGPSAPPMKIVRKIRSLKASNVEEEKKAQLKPAPIAKAEQKTGSPQVSMYRRKKYVRKATKNNQLLCQYYFRQSH
eukprot:TRINITY_DN587_c8_g1_i1.p1 TRINITY_DN587_c8_g1~~TRINITY_DN587_c8_g1_i1.p1  ORF type:complete len:982 (+),score=125.04 TRINITY_DN587_c8_g1_i1:15279-18224(+)